MKLTLISTPTRLYLPNGVIPLGIISLAAYLEQLGYTIQVIDAARTRQSHNEIIEEIKNFSPDMIGVGGIITAYYYIIQLTNALKGAFPEIPIVLGGQITINNHYNCFKHMGVDFLVYGYGEIPMHKLLRHHSGELAKQDIPGISYLEDGYIINNPGREFVESFDDLPFPAYHCIDMGHYLNNIHDAKLSVWLKKTGKTVRNFKNAVVLGAIGCIGRCTFCVHEQEYVGMRYHTNDYVIRNMELLYNEYDVNIFSIGEEMFFANNKKVSSFINEATSRLPNVVWRTATLAKFVTPELMKIIDTPDSNCYLIGFGFESGSQRILDIMKKDSSRVENMRAYKLLNESKYVTGGGSLMVGNVGEDDRSVEETADAMRKINMYKTTVFFTQPYPGGRIWDWAVERKVVPDTHDYLLRASGKDADGNINANLTPHPNWILWMLRFHLLSVVHNENLRRELEINGKALSLVERVRLMKRVFFPAFRERILMKNSPSQKPPPRWYGMGRDFVASLINLPIWITPEPFMYWTAKAYFIYYRFTRKFFTTEKDRRYQFETDSKMALKPDNLRIGVPSRKLTDQKIVELFIKNSPSKTPLEPNVRSPI